MAERKSQNGNIETYLAKVRYAHNGEVVFSYWDSKRVEHVGSLPRDYFPEKNLKAGRVFKYQTKISIEMVPIRKISKSELAKMYQDITRKLRVVEPLFDSSVTHTKRGLD